MPMIRFYVSDEVMKMVREAADERGISVQDYAREKLLGKESSGLTIEDVLCEIRKQKPEGTFSIPELFAPEVWQQVPFGQKGYLGKALYENVNAGKITEIAFAGIKNRRATYKIINEKGED